MLTLSPEELVALVRSVFPRFETDRVLAILVDVPRQPELDNPAWKERRRLAGEWHVLLQARRAEIPLDAVQLVAYPDVGSNNADLPAEGFLLDGPPARCRRRAGAGGETGELRTGLRRRPAVPGADRVFDHRAAQGRGPALPLPGGDHARLRRLDDPRPAHRLRRGGAARGRPARPGSIEADHADISFTVDGKSDFALHFDLRRRTAHASSGRFPELATAGNLPSGEAYIVPYEGEAGDASRTAGVLPVEIDGEVVLFTIRANRAEAVEGEGPQAQAERAHLAGEPAYGNMAELGFGVLADFGLEPTGEILLDEKLGLHIAFGRSEHFGGAVGPKDFSSPSAVIHLDRIYIPQAQPRIGVNAVILGYGDGRSETVMANGAYTIF